MEDEHDVERLRVFIMMLLFVLLIRHDARCTVWRVRLRGDERLRVYELFVCVCLYLFMHICVLSANYSDNSHTFNLFLERRHHTCERNLERSRLVGLGGCHG